MVRLEIRFKGRVQGVGFRFFVCQLANEYGCTGWVQNQYDGTVLCELQGKSEKIDKVLNSVLKGNRFIDAEIEYKKTLQTVKENSFSIKH